MANNPPPKLQPPPVGSIILLLLVSNCLIIVSNLSESIKGNSILSDPYGFKVNAKVHLIKGHDLEKTNQVEVEEHYSNVQQRAKLIFISQMGDEEYLLSSPRLEYYAANKLHKSHYKRYLLRTISIENSDIECKQVDTATLALDLFGKSAKEDDNLTGEGWLEDIENVPSYIIGLSRLLYVVENHKDKMIREPESEIMIRNHETAAYKMQAYLGETHPIKLSDVIAYFPTATSVQSALPLKIWIRLPDGAEIVVDYNRIEAMINPDDMKIEDGSLNYLGDSFTFPLGIGCSSQLKPAVESDDLKNLPKLVSFRADILKNSANLKKPTATSRHFVAYDGYEKKFRFDRIKEGDGILSEEEYWITIYILRRNKQFNMRSVANKDQTLDFVPSQCVAAKISREGWHYTRNPHEPLIPFDQLVEMGSSIVRNVRARSFEQLTSDLPTLFFPRVNFKDLNGKERVHWIPKDKMINKFSIIYHFATNDSSEQIDDLGPLMRVDILSMQELVYRIEIFDFVWHLNESPNGDHRDELFTLYDRCPMGEESSANRYAKLELQLQHYQGDRDADKQSLKEVLDLLSNPIERNKALSRGLVNGLDSIGPDISDLKSRVHISQAGRVLLGVNAHLSVNQIRDIYLPITVATGTPNSAMGYETLRATSFNECFWLASHRRKEIDKNLLFSYCFESCIIDTDPLGLVGSDGKAALDLGLSNTFITSTKDMYPCLIMKLDEYREEDDGDEPDKVWSVVYHGLKDQTVRLPDIKQKTDSTGSRSLFFNIIQLKVDRSSESAKLMSYWDSRGSKSSPRDKILQGIGLIEQPGIKKIDSSDLPGRDLENTRLVDHSFCQSACVSDLTCKSFSVCLRGREVECMTSGIDFRNSNLRSELERKLNYSQHPTSIIIESQKQPSQSIRLQNLELRLDRGCRIHNKRATDMFRIAPTIIVDLKKNPPLGVENEEQCAEICLNMNIRHVEEISKLGNKSIQDHSIKSRQDKSPELNDSQQDSIRSWCSGFSYYNLATLTTINSFRPLLDPKLLKSGGLCVPSNPDWLNSDSSNSAPDNKTNNVKEDPNLLRSARLMSFDFNYINLFEQQVDFRLNPRLLSETKLTYNDSNINESNNQIVFGEMSDPETCAKACFSQAIPLKPSCKSFDTVEIQREEKSNSYCIFNPITHEEALQMRLPENLIKLQSSEGVKYRHFEPKEVLTIDSKLLRDHSSPSKAHETSQYIGMGSLGILFTIFISLISGLFLSLSVKSRLALLYPLDGRKGSIMNPSRSFLSSLTVDDEQTTHCRFEVDLDLPNLMSPDR